MDKRLFVLAALVAAVWAGIHFWPEDKTPEKSDPIWLKLQPAKVKKIEQTAAESFSLDMNNGEWRLTLSGDKKTPEPLRASLLTVEALINFVSGNAPIRRLGPIPPDKAKDFGLDKPKYSVTITSETPWTIELGDKNPTNDGIYARSTLEPGECLLLDPKYAEQLGRKPDHYYDLRLADFPAETVSKIRVSRNVADKKDAEVWEIERGDKAFAFVLPADYVGKPLAEQDADSYARALSLAKGKQLLLPAPPTPDAPYATVSIWRKGVEAPVTYEFFKFPADFSVPGLAGQSFCRSSWQKGLLSLEKGDELRLIRDAFALRDRAAYKADVDALRKMKILRHERQPTAEFLASKADKGGWIDAAGKPLSGMDLLVWRLAQVNYEAEPVKALPEGAKLVVEWSLYKDKEQPEATLSFYRDPAGPKGRCWLVVNNGENKFPVEDKLLNELTRDVPGDSINPDDMIMPPGMGGQGLPPGMQLSLPPGVGNP